MDRSQSHCQKLADANLCCFWILRTRYKVVREDVFEKVLFRTTISKLVPLLSLDKLTVNTDNITPCLFITSNTGCPSINSSPMPQRANIHSQVTSMTNSRSVFLLCHIHGKTHFAFIVMQHSGLNSDIFVAETDDIPTFRSSVCRFLKNPFSNSITLRSVPGLKSSGF